MVSSRWCVRLSQLSASLVYSLEPATGTHTVWSISQLPSVNVDRVFEYETGQWVISFYSTAIATNIIATGYDISSVANCIDFTGPCYLGILAFKLWLIHRRSSGIRTTKSRAYPIPILIMECGALYSMSLVTMLATYLTASNSAYIVIDMVRTPRNERCNPPH